MAGRRASSGSTAADEAKAYPLVQQAVSHKAYASARERAYIDALAARYSGNAGGNRLLGRFEAQSEKRLVAVGP
jgi:hypothetical protein